MNFDEVQLKSRFPEFSEAVPIHEYVARAQTGFYLPAMAIYKNDKGIVPGRIFALGSTPDSQGIRPLVDIDGEVQDISRTLHGLPLCVLVNRRPVTEPNPP
jgi:hypothetical protein